MNQDNINTELEEIRAETQKNVESRVDIVLDAIIQGTIALIPVGGNYIVAAMSSAQIGKLKDRIDKFATELRAFGVNHLSKDFIYSDEGYDLLLSACQKVANTRSAEKHKGIAEVVAGVANASTLAISDAEIFLKIIDSSTEEEILLFIALCKKSIEEGLEDFCIIETALRDTDNRIFFDLMQELRVPSERNVYIAKRLEGLGLLNEGDTADSIGGKRYKFTEIGRKFCKFIMDGE